MNIAIWWLRRDLRLFDNQALQAALKSAAQVLPVFILDPHLLSSPYASTRRLTYLLDGLRSLDEDLRRRGSRVVFLQGAPLQALTTLVQQTGAQAIFAEADHSPYARQRDGQIAASLPLQLVGSPAVIPPGLVLKTNGQPYTVFTPFSRAWKSLPGISSLQPIPAPEHIPTPQFPPGDPLPPAPPAAIEPAFTAGEASAQHRLHAFVAGLEAPLYTYAEARNRMDLDGTSGLSPYLRLGMLSPRQAAAAAWGALRSAGDPNAAKSAETWLNELIWREFYIHILHHFPQVLRRNFRHMHIDWQNNTQDLTAWQHGQTGYPVVDAAMRQLAATGWMHNRARMIVASFLTKDLLVDWRLGERWFMQYLLDGDPAANNGGWQWTVGTGTDAAPYFRIFNPVLQSARFDPQGVYLRRWLPELQPVPDEYIHEPWKMPQSLQNHLGVRIGRTYPAPIIDHHFARQRVLEAYHTQPAGSGEYAHG